MQKYIVDFLVHRKVQVQSENNIQAEYDAAAKLADEDRKATFQMRVYTEDGLEDTGFYRAEPKRWKTDAINSVRLYFDTKYDCWRPTDRRAIKLFSDWGVPADVSPRYCAVPRNVFGYLDNATIAALVVEAQANGVTITFLPEKPKEVR